MGGDRNGTIRQREGNERKANVNIIAEIVAIEMFCNFSIKIV
jgi:hypothetical protein